MITYTKGQQAAIDKLKKFVVSKDSIFRLTGSAGVGKTFALGVFATLPLQGDLIATAPTHKAVGVLAFKMPDVSCMTIHKFLGLRPTKKGDTTVLSRSRTYDPTEYFNVKYVVLDEGSMVDQQLTDYILQDIETWGRKYIIVGDLYQLPPISCIGSPLFDIELSDDCKHELTEVVRQAEGSPIINTATQIRDAIINNQEPPYYSGVVDGKGVYLMKHQPWVDKLKEYALMPEFSDDPDFCRVLAYTNDTVLKHSQEIRQMLGEPMDTPFSVGENVTANEAWIQSDEVIFNTGAEFTVVAMEPHTHPVYSNIQGWQVWLEGYESIPVYILDILKYGTAYKNQKGKLAVEGKQSGQWMPYYQLTEYFADLRLTCSQTVHKCLPLSAKVLTDKGAVPLGELTHNHLVKSKDGSYRKILDISPILKKPETVIRTLSGRVFSSSEDHRFLTGWGYIKASHISLDDHICLLRDKFLPSLTIDDTYWAYGYMVANGCYSYKSNRVDITLLKDSNVVPKLKQFLSKYGSIVHEYTKEGNKAYTLSAESKELREELSSVGLTRVTGKYKDACKFETLSQKASFIRGVMDGDGSCSSKHAIIRLVSCSENLVDSTMMLLQEFGIIGRKKYVPPTSTNHSGSFVLSITGVDCLKYRDSIDFYVDYKKNRLAQVCLVIKGKTNVDVIPEYLGIRVKLKQELRKCQESCNIGSLSSYLSHKNLSWHQCFQITQYLQDQGLGMDQQLLDLLDNYYFYDRVLSVEQSGNVLDMMDIEVQDQHNFIYNGAIVHNSQGSTFKNVFIDLRDIYTNRTLAEADRCFYVAVTRASDNVYIKV